MKTINTFNVLCLVYVVTSQIFLKGKIINITKLIEVCCEGYMEQNNFCISLCQNCQHGLCIRGNCMCEIGWNGPRCDTRATSTSPTSSSRSTILGTTMSEIFQISNVYISAATIFEEGGPSATTMSYSKGRDENARSSTQSKITSDYDISKFTAIDTGASLIADFDYRSSSTAPATTNNTIDVVENYTILATSRETNFYTSRTADTPSLLLNKDLGLKDRSKPNKFSQSAFSTENSYFDMTITETINIPASEKKLVKNIGLMTQSTETVENSLDYRETDRDIFRGPSLESTSKMMGIWNIIKVTDTKLTTTLMPQTVLTKPSTAENFKIEGNVILRGNTLQKLEERFGKGSSIEKLSKNPQLTLSDPTSKNFIYSLCAASLTTVIILVVVITLYAVRNSRKNFEKHKSKKDVAVYTTSIFHSPLPDPPMFDNLTHLATRTNRNSWNQEKRESMDIPELNVVFEKPVASTKLDSKLYFYDHPPSTGSYRASSEVDTFSHYNLSQKSMSAIVLEPVYDEIPSKPGSITEECTNANRTDLDSRVRRNADSNCLYMNICDRTKF